MNIYRWYTEALGMSGITCAQTKEVAVQQAEGYLRDRFPWDNEELYYRGYEDIELQVWPITEDSDYDTKHPMTVVTSY